MKLKSICVLTFGVCALLMSYAFAKSIRQPIGYNHKKHVQDLEMDCTECHRYAKRLPRATIPNIEVCQDCHSEAITDSPEEKKLVDYISKGEKIPWRKVYRVASHVYFSHRRHTVLGGIDCTACHGDIKNQTEPITKQAILVSMKNCLKCHEERKINNECTRCHR